MTKTEQDLVAKYEELYAMLPAKISGVKFGEEMIFGGRLERAYRSAALIFDHVKKIADHVSLEISTTTNAVSPDVLIAKVAEKFCITPMQLKCGGRKRERVDARAVFSALLLINSELTLTDIAKYLRQGVSSPNYFDHSTILHHKKKYINFLDAMGKEAKLISEIIHELELTNYNTYRLYAKYTKPKKQAA